jgi:hypothetical protein
MPVLGIEPRESVRTADLQSAPVPYRFHRRDFSVFVHSPAGISIHKIGALHPQNATYSGHDLIALSTKFLYLFQCALAGVYSLVLKAFFSDHVDPSICHDVGTISIVLVGFSLGLGSARPKLRRAFLDSARWSVDVRILLTLLTPNPAPKHFCGIHGF